MAPLVFLALGPQDPFFGISRENVVDRLTRLNWKTRAMVRLSDAGPLYVWISRGEKGGRGKPKERFYQVGVDGTERKQKDLEADFAYSTLAGITPRPEGRNSPAPGTAPNQTSGKTVPAVPGASPCRRARGSMSVALGAQAELHLKGQRRVDVETDS